MQGIRDSVISERQTRPFKNCLLQAALKESSRAIRLNLIPGIVLQTLMAGMGAAYLWDPSSRRAFGALAELRTSWGLIFSFLGTSVAAAIFPEILRLLLPENSAAEESEQKIGIRLLFGIPFWGIVGMQVDLFYRLQYFLFGPSDSAFVILKKVLVDALIYCPVLAIPQVVCMFLWRDHGFSLKGFQGYTPLDFYALKIFPVLVANWMIWIPLVCIIYALPAALGVPFFIVGETFWVMVLTTLSASSQRKSRNRK